MTVRKDNELPLNFRAEVVSTILHILAAGDSCSVVGIGSVGKSNLMRFLQREDIRRAYLGNQWKTWLFVYVDVNKLLKQSLWGLLELMLHQLLIELTNRKADKETLQTLDDLHRRTAAPETRYLALRYLDRAVSLACNRLGLRLVFLLDEFDELCRTMPPLGFAALRALRDDHKYRLMYLVATRLELARLRQELGEIETFEELVSPHTVWLGPYSADDARFMLHRLDERHNAHLDTANVDVVLHATGGHPGLLREAYHVARERQPNLLESLAVSWHVQDECQRIWLSLTEEEQRFLVNFAGDLVIQPPQSEAMERLRCKGLLGGPWADGDRIFSPLFAEYVKQQHPVVGARIHIDHRRRAVWVNGREIKNLSPLEYKLMAYLTQRRSQVCSRDELAQHLYPDDATLEGEGVTDSRIDSVIKRLRHQIEPHPKAPQYLVTVRGHGFCLKDGDETKTWKDA